MTENQKNSEEGWVMLNAKVPPHIGTLFNILARQRGMTSYEMLQLLINGFITASSTYETSIHSQRSISLIGSRGRPLRNAPPDISFAPSGLSAVSRSAVVPVRITGPRFVTSSTVPGSSLRLDGSTLANSTPVMTTRPVLPFLRNREGRNV